MSPQPKPAPLSSLPPLPRAPLPPLRPSMLPTSTAPPAPWGVRIEGQLGVVFCLCARIPFRVQEGGASCKEQDQGKEHLQSCLHGTTSLGKFKIKINKNESRLTDNLGGVAMGTGAFWDTDLLEKSTFIWHQSLKPYLHPARALPRRAIANGSLLGRPA